MYKASSILASLLLFVCFALASEWKTIRSSEEPFTVEVLETDGNRTILRYTVNKYLTDDIIIGGEAYTLLRKLRKESMIEREGFPRLPRINRSIVIPDNGEMSYEIISSEYISLFLVLPPIFFTFLTFFSLIFVSVGALLNSFFLFLCD